MSSRALLLLAAVGFAQLVGTPDFVVPHFHDLTVVTRRTYEERTSSVTTERLLLKGARERREQILKIPGHGELTHGSITQCDERRTISLNNDTRLYAVSRFEEWSQHLKRVRPVRESRDGALVEITTQIADTGERKQLGSYTLRRVKTTTTVEPTPGANTQASREDWDGWYIDLSGLGCSGSEISAMLRGEVVHPGKPRDRMRIRQLGNARRGYPIEETVRSTQAGRTSITKLELVDFSETPLDPALFDIPAGYRPALPLPYGGVDLSKPDTFANRLQSYWGELMAWAGRIFR
jgi:hypothetical protein